VLERRLQANALQANARNIKGAHPIIAFGNGWHNAFGADAAHYSFESKLETKRPFHALDSHWPFKICSEVAIAFAADTGEGQVWPEYPEALRYYVFWRHVRWKFAAAIDALVHANWAINYCGSFHSTSILIVP
jgi:hypothetical protein